MLLISPHLKSFWNQTWSDRKWMTSKMKCAEPQQVGGPVRGGAKWEGLGKCAVGVASFMCEFVCLLLCRTLAALSLARRTITLTNISQPGEQLHWPISLSARTISTLTNISLASEQLHSVRITLTNISLSQEYNHTNQYPSQPGE